MTFKQAEKKLRKLACGKYHSLGYEKTNFHLDTLPSASTCKIYIDGEDVHVGPTWEEAFHNREIKIDRPFQKEPEL